MKKILIVLMCFIFCLFPLSGCNDDSDEYYTVTFYVAIVQNSTKYYREQSNIEVKHGDVIGNKAPSVSYRDYIWYTSKAGNIEWNLYSDEVKSDMNLYGRW